MDVDDTRSISQIENEIEASRDQLATTIDELVYRVKPKTILQRQASAANSALKSATCYPDGSVRIDRIAIASAVVLALVALGVYRRTRG